jgi:hypothetical protein
VQSLICSDDAVRVSLDEVLSTDVDRLYLVPLAKSKAPCRKYWSLLVSRKSGQPDAYQRHGIATTDLEACQQAFPKGEIQTWKHAFYPRWHGTATRAFKTDDFEGSPTKMLGGSVSADGRLPGTQIIKLV